MYKYVRLAPDFQHYLFLGIWKTHTIYSVIYI